MKNIRRQIREALIQELGDTTDIYRYRLHHKDTDTGFQNFFLLRYAFKTEKGTPYGVNIDYVWGENASGYATVDFTASGSYGGTVDEGTTFRAVATVIRILADFWKSRYAVIEGEFNGAVPQEAVDALEGFRFGVTSSSDDKEHPERTSRFKLYKAFIDQQFPSASVEIRGTKGFGTLVFVTPRS